ncbi:hypothetical protein [Dyadobacter sp. 32]|uniref:hypothetical protein n=1 Tax=Dyadobacter sp. 32 TaxID=538966 RepID=UPI0011EF724A
MHNMYGVNYMPGPAYLAGFYKRMGEWIKHLNLCPIIGKYLCTSESRRQLNENEKRNLRTIILVPLLSDR